MCCVIDDRCQPKSMQIHTHTHMHRKWNIGEIFRNSCGACNVTQAIDSSNAENDTANNFCLVDFRTFNNLKRSNKITGSHVKSLILVLVLCIINISLDLQTELAAAKCIHCTWIHQTSKSTLHELRSFDFSVHEKSNLHDDREIRCIDFVRNLCAQMFRIGYYYGGHFAFYSH